MYDTLRLLPHFNIRVAFIKCFIKDEIMGRLAPFYTSVGGVGAVKLIIPESELENAQPIVENFIKQWFLSKYYASLV